MKGAPKYSAGEQVEVTVQAVGQHTVRATLRRKTGSCLEYFNIQNIDIISVATVVPYFTVNLSILLINCLNVHKTNSRKV